MKHEPKRGNSYKIDSNVLQI